MNPKDYIQLEEVAASLELVGTSFANEDMQRAITTASRVIDGLCRRRFWADAEDDSPTVRAYTPVSKSVVFMDDAITVDEVRVDGDLLDEADYTLGPANAEAFGKPWSTVRADGRFGLCHTVTVSARWGWAEVPEEISRATQILATKYLRRMREAPFGIITAGIEAGAVMRVAAADPDVPLMIRPYVRKALFV